MSETYSNYMWQTIVNELLAGRNNVNVSNDYHEQIKQIDKVLSNDKSAIVSSIYEFMVESANVNFQFESGNENLDKKLSTWANNINLGINEDIPSGLRAVTEQYLRERWRSSFIALNIVWKEVDGFQFPSRMWFTDGEAITVEGKENKLDGYTYYVGEGKKKKPLKSTKTKTVIIRKPYNTWYEKYPTPYLVHKGALYHSLVKTEIVQKQTELIESIIPHILLIKAGNDIFAKKSDGMPTETELEELKTKVKSMADDSKYRSSPGDNYGAFPYDVTLENLIPDLTKFLNETILKPTNNNIMSALGLIELEGFAKSRQETILNPKVLVEEVRDAVKDWQGMLEDILKLIVERNIEKHPKSANKKVRVVPGIVKAFLTNDDKVLLRSIFDRGTIGHQDILESTTDLDFDVSMERRINERENNIDNILYPHIIMNQEAVPDVNEDPESTKESTPEKKKTEKDIETSEIEDFTKLPRVQGLLAKKEYVQAPYETIDDLPDNIKNVLPVGAQVIWLNAFNSAIADGKSEDSARKIAWSAVKKKYKKVKDKKKWVKK